MPPRDWKIRIEDILEAISRIKRYTAATSFGDFCKDEKTVDAVIRNITIIGEAAGNELSLPSHHRRPHRL